ncbi:MAG: hypothetical protein Q8J63_05485 [Candidatus Aquicultor sp.]|nr:hypothetical protein [Candidatus Aquicultor sp.]
MSGNIGSAGVLASDQQVAENYNLAAGGMWRSDITHLFAYMMQPAGLAPYPANNTGALAPFTAYKMFETSDGQLNDISSSLTGAEHKTGQLKQSRTVAWTDWRTNPAVNSAVCSDDGVSWPHRTLGWKMLKDDLFGIGLKNGVFAVIDVNETRSVGGTDFVAHDLDSVCLDCHNPTVWNAASSSDHTDSAMDPNDDRDDDVLLRGLP